MLIKKITILLSFLFLCLAQSAQAASLYFDSEKNIKTNSFFELGLLVDSQDEDINAIEGSLNFPNDILTFIDVKENNSIISFWIEKPSLVSSNSIKFSGIIPGGYSGNGNLFKVIFKTKKIGHGNIDINNIKVLLNDGLGTEANVQKQLFSFEVSDQAPSGEEVVIVDLSDQEAPDPFSPVISKIPEIGGDNYLLMFNTQDKGSGIDYYEVKEGFYPFMKAESPYLLRNQELDKKIVVKAVDKSGNERMVTISPVYPSPWYENFLFFAIIIIVIIVSFSLGRVSWTKTKKKK